MRTKEFLVALKELRKNGWRVIQRRNGLLRVRSHRKRKVCHCPITAIATRRGWRLHGDLTNAETWSAAKHIGLSKRNANRIIKATDNTPENIRGQHYWQIICLRKEILDALLPS